ncbi:MAG: hypothetical protein KF773_39255 [Deltaproteobacteria bacterium]|nr:hypothetical protein [Deltaproteobacteria bacterium]
MLRAILFASLLSCVAGCPDRSIAKVDPEQSGAFTKNIPISAEIDILFVIDNSGSTKQKQTLFARNFEQFVTAIDTKFPQGRPNLHIGVVSSTIDLGVNVPSAPACHPAVGENGLLQNTRRPQCDPASGPPTGRFIEDIALPTGGRRTNYPGELSKALPCIAQLGDTGCGFESPLEAMKRALDGSNPQNAGFLREDAFLAVVILTDEDDCSAKKPTEFFSLPTSMVGPDDMRCSSQAFLCDQPISTSAPGDYTNCRVRTDSYLTAPSAYAEFLATVKDPSRTVVALIAGDPKSDISFGRVVFDATVSQPLGLLPSCNTTIDGNPQIGRPANRLAAFLGTYGNRGLFRTVCQADYSQALADIGQLLFNAVSPCLEGELSTRDVDDRNPGTQLDCEVSDVVDPFAAHPIETQIPRCAMADATTPAAGGTRPCYWIASNPAACTTATGLELRVERTSPPAAGTELRVSCALE